MAVLTTFEQAEPPVPVVDMAVDEEAAARTVREACETTGFFYVTNHGIPEDLITKQFAKAKEFFDLPIQEKQKSKVNKYYHGWTPMNDEKLSVLGDQKVADTKEGMYIAREVAEGSEENKLPLHGPNNWPAESSVPGFRKAMEAYHKACIGCTMRINRLIALALDLPATYFDKDFVKLMALLRPLHYACVASSPDEGIFGAGAHTDYGMLTILATDNNPGLQVLMDGKWVSIPPKQGHLIINLGDMLHRWSNGRFQSGLHRVVTLPGQERYSTAFFAEPSFKTVIAPLPTCVSEENPAKWPPTTSGEYLMSKYNATHSTYKSRQEGAVQATPSAPSEISVTA
ncbi:hypothetical protein WJX73_006573 [Symbiochloris irregularis]|uniref:Fe2OG dioxygenase domain-containing protein n=1 Tax=Symbiochloris irregularis TaxID=706552 RepID=A0AAW1NP88_9CHLO